jgi:hypothetical protein
MLVKAYMYMLWRENHYYLQISYSEWSKTDTSTPQLFISEYNIGKVP